MKHLLPVIFFISTFAFAEDQMLSCDIPIVGVQEKSRSFVEFELKEFEKIIAKHESELSSIKDDTIEGYMRNLAFLAASAWKICLEEENEKLSYWQKTKGFFGSFFD